MSYAVNKFKAGEVHFEGLAVGWYFKETEEFRPLMTDLVMELFLEGLIDEDVVYATAKAREVYTETTLNAYIKKEAKRTEYSAEDIFDMQAAFGADADVTNIFTGEILHLAEY